MVCERVVAMQRFRRRNMIMEETPDSPQPNTPYPKVLSAEYFQAIQENTFFNHRGYDAKPKEAFGVVLLEFQDHTANGLTYAGTDDGRNAPQMFRDNGGKGLAALGSDRESQRGSVASAQTQVLLASSLESLAVRQDPYANINSKPITARFVKQGGTAEFSAANSYTVQLTVDQFIGIDYDNPLDPADTGFAVPERTPVQPLLNPSNQAIWATTVFHFYNRHSNSTRASIINLFASDFTPNSFRIYATRTNVYGEIWLSLTSRRVVPIHDYETPGLTNAVVSYTPSTDPVTGSVSNIPLFNIGNAVSYPRNILRVSWVAKGV